MSYVRKHLWTAPAVGAGGILGNAVGPTYSLTLYGWIITETAGHAVTLTLWVPGAPTGNGLPPVTPADTVGTNIYTISIGASGKDEHSIHGGVYIPNGCYVTSAGASGVIVGSFIFS